MSPARVSPVSFLKLSSEVASFYGFGSMRDIERGLARSARVRGTPSFSTATALCAARVTARPLEPVLAFYATPSPSHLPATIAAREAGEFGLCAVGGDASSGEMVILKTLSAIVHEWGAPIARIRLNALGDKDSRERYARERLSYLRRRAGELNPLCRVELTKSSPSSHHCEHPECRGVRGESPRSVNYLSEKSRAHFRKVLEQVEGLGFPYEIDDLLLGDEREQHIVFAIDLASEDSTVVGSFGGRYDDYLRRLLNRKEGVAVSASIFFRKKGATRNNFFVAPPARAPKIFFVQLGPLAKLQGLAVLDMLRRARLPVSQSFDASRLSPQLTAAGATGVPYLLIMGQREALDGTIILRELKNGSQTIIQLVQLPRILKNLRV